MSSTTETVKCSEVYKECAFSVTYGGGPGGYTFCDYIVVTGKRRGCKPEECDKFKRKKGSK